jgi:hypothetical protein
VVVGDGGREAYTAIAWGATLSLEIPDIAEAETVASVEGNMCGPAMRGADAVPGSKTASRAKGTRRNLGGSYPAGAAQAASVRIGRARSRNRTQLAPQESDARRTVFARIKGVWHEFSFTRETEAR